MRARQLRLTESVEFTPPSFPDSRGSFTAPFQGPVFAEALGFPLTVAQVNHSVSARDVIRGLHFADVPPGQAKYIHCPSGALLDIVVDLRVGSPTFGQWDSVRLDDTEHRCVYIGEGLGHAFLALADNTVATYLCSTPYNPAAEHGIDPLDPELGLPWEQFLHSEPVLSEKDRTAPSLADARASGLLPDFAACQRRYAELRS